MKLRFIGKDGSMGLVHGAMYHCYVITITSFEQINPEKYDAEVGQKLDSVEGTVHVYFYTTRYGIPGYCYCPYSSLAKALENWEEVSNL